ncbi:MAG: helix-turn-helix domain-containing protein [Candidatus Paceibacterota bacterium]
MTQDEALTILKMGHNVFLTGAAGSGKTYTLRNYIKFLKDLGVGVAVTASTGIAATHLGGTTIHSWSGLGIRSFLSEQDIDELEDRAYLWERYENTSVLIIDEISMLHHFRFDLLDRLCKNFKRNDMPFGGMQVVLCGDFFQLPPVSRAGELEAHFVYKSKAWKAMNLKICYLTEQFRQSDKMFLRILNEIRDNNLSEEGREELQSRFNKKIKGTIEPTKLFSHNADVDLINSKELEKISGDEKMYLMESHGSKKIVETLKKSCLAPEELYLKVGAKVMCVKNNYEKGYVNGTLGVVEMFDDFGMPVIKTFMDKIITINPEEWIIEEDGKKKASIKQLPIRLAWAITVHKSQGMSLDSAEIDLSQSFVAGMGYVALSRVRSLSGLKLLGLNEMALAVHPEVLKFDQHFRKESVRISNAFPRVSKNEIQKRHDDFLDKVVPKDGGKKEKAVKVPTHHKTMELLKEKLSLKEIAKARDLKEETVIDHIEKLLEEKADIKIGYLNNFKEEKFDKIADAFKKSFEKNGDYRLSPVRDMLGKKFTYAELRLARLFL